MLWAAPHLLGASEGLDALLADSKGIEEEKAGTDRWITGIQWPVVLIGPWHVSLVYKKGVATWI